MRKSILSNVRAAVAFAAAALVPATKAQKSYRRYSRSIPAVLKLMSDLKCTAFEKGPPHAGHDFGS